MIIKLLEKEEIKQTKELFDKVIDEIHSDISMQERASYKNKYTEEILGKLIDNDNNYFIIAKSQDKVVGFVFALTFSGIGKVHWIGIDKEYRKNGYASALLKNVIDYFSKTCYKVELYTYMHQGTISFFEKHGFKKGFLIDKNFCKMQLLNMYVNFRTPTDEEVTKCIIITGEAGQGIKLMGKVLAEILTKLNKEVSLSIVYGPDVRSGGMHAELVYSNNKIMVPFIKEADILLELCPNNNYCTGTAFCVKEQINENIVVNKFGKKVFVNMFALGRVLKLIGIDLEKINIEQNLPKRFIEKNIEAISYGFSYREFLE